MLTTILLSAAALTSNPVGNPQVSWSAPARYLDGGAYKVTVEIEAPTDGSAVASWLMTPAAFQLNGKPLADRSSGVNIPMAAGAKLSLEFDLAPSLKSSPTFNGKDFKLGFASQFSDAEAKEVSVCKLAPEGLNFMEMPVGNLTNYQVILDTNRGEMVLEFWPEAAPNHVRNYLDLCYTGFYDGLTFHRVIPGFMIQGGCPNGNGGGNGPRMLNSEFSTDPKYAHLPGVLSMARTNDPNSASCQFFVMHKTSSHLDGKYSVFGKLVEGQDVVDAIVMTPTSAGSKPTKKQYIRSASVIVVK